MSNEPLACGHPDTTPEEWHNDEYGEQVCADCCFTCRLFDDQGQGPAKPSHWEWLVRSIALILFVLWVHTITDPAHDKPDCPTEDSCTVDYVGGQWHIEETNP